METGATYLGADLRRLRVSELEIRTDGRGLRTADSDKGQNGDDRRGQAPSQRKRLVT